MECTAKPRSIIAGTAGPRDVSVAIPADCGSPPVAATRSPISAGHTPQLRTSRSSSTVPADSVAHARRVAALKIDPDEALGH